MRHGGHNRRAHWPADDTTSSPYRIIAISAQHRDGDRDQPVVVLGQVQRFAEGHHRRRRRSCKVVADEEDASLGTETALADLAETGLRPEVAVVGEPTALDRTVSLRGFAVVEVEMTGRAAHSSMPAEGVNAVTHLGRLLTAVEQADAALQGGGSLLATVTAGGQAPFSLAASARASLERRTTPEEGVQQAVADVEQILDRLCKDDPTFSARARLVVGRDAWRLDDTGPGGRVRRSARHRSA